MSLPEYIPGMKPGAWLRNIIVALILIAVPYLIPFALAFAVGTNRGGLADGLGRAGVPTFKGGGVVPAVITIVVAMLVFATASTGFSIVVDGLSGSDNPMEGADEAAPTDTADNGKSGYQGDDATKTDSADDAEAEAEDVDQGQSQGAGTEPSNGQGQGYDAEDQEAGANTSNESDRPVTATTNESDTGSDAAEAGASQSSSAESGTVGVEDFEQSVRGAAIDVEATEESDGTTTLVYRTHEPDTDAVVREIMYIAGIYSGYATDTTEGTEELRGVVLDGDGSELGTFRVDAGVARGYYSGSVSDGEFYQHVTDSIETTDG